MSQAFVFTEVMCRFSSLHLVVLHSQMCEANIDSVVYMQVNELLILSRKSKWNSIFSLEVPHLERRDITIDIVISL